MSTPLLGNILIIVASLYVLWVASIVLFGLGERPGLEALGYVLLAAGFFGLTVPVWRRRRRPLT